MPATSACPDSKHWFTTSMSFLQPLPYISYATGYRKLSANEQFFVGAQTVVRLLRTTQIISDICFITDHVLTPAQIKPKSFETRQNSFFFYPGWMCLLVWALGCFYSQISTQTFRRVLTSSVDSCAEIKSAPSVA